MSDEMREALMAAERARIGWLTSEPVENWRNIEPNPEDLPSMAAAVAAFLRLRAACFGECGHYGLERLLELDADAVEDLE